MNRKAIGDNAERLACQYLQRHGLKLLGRNFRCRGGEIDLIMQHGDSLVFVEVRYRRRTGFGRAASFVAHRSISTSIGAGTRRLDLMS
jgi:putative endonuclease